MRRFEVYEDAPGQLRWRLKAPSGGIIADSGESYETRHNANPAAESVRVRSAQAPTVDV